MSDLNREELKASMAASEAKVAATLEIMRRESAEARAELKTTLSSFQAENALFREQMRGYASTTQLEGAQLREQVKIAMAEMRSDFARHSKEVESKISGLKIWVLAGALSGAVALLVLLLRPSIPQWVQATSPATSGQTSGAPKSSTSPKSSTTPTKPASE